MVCIVFYYCLLTPLYYINRWTLVTALEHTSIISCRRWRTIVENQLARWYNQHWSAAFAWYGLNGGIFFAGPMNGESALVVVESGDNVDEISEERCVLMANHLGLVDHFILMAGLNPKGTLSGRVSFFVLLRVTNKNALQWLWVIFHLWKWTPMGIAWQLHGNYFINGGRTKRKEALEQFTQHLNEHYWAEHYTWLVMYPEGSRLFLIRESSRKFAQANALPLLNHCANPRTGAMYTVLKATAQRR